MTSFDFLWLMLDRHGVIERYKGDCLDLWNKYSLEQQRYIYRSIRDKISKGEFVNYHPVKAVRDNEPKKPKIQIMSSEEYYRINHTQANLNGWVRTFLPDQQKTIYVKQA